MDEEFVCLFKCFFLNFNQRFTCSKVIYMFRFLQVNYIVFKNVLSHISYQVNMKKIKSFYIFYVIFEHFNFYFFFFKKKVHLIKLMTT